MKKITLLAALFVFGKAAIASETVAVFDRSQFPVSIDQAEPIVFTERGIEFFVFADGQFDFNTRPSANDGSYYYKTAGRRSVNKTFGAPGVNPNSNYGVLVEHDDFGRVRRVGNVFINYDGNDRIKRIGSVYMSYQRHALTQVGGLKIIYNRRGQIVDYIGAVNGRRNAVYTQPAYANNGNGGYSSGHNYNNPDGDYYYYKSNGTKAILENKR